MSETIETIIQWHRETFPYAGKQGQLDKFVIEFKEFANTLFAEPREPSTHQIEELADLTIVACGVARFDLARAQICFAVVASLTDLFCIPDQEIKYAVDKKMAINRTRRWNQCAGMYQHVDE